MTNNKKTISEQFEEYDGHQVDEHFIDLVCYCGVEIVLDSEEKIMECEVCKRKFKFVDNKLMIMVELPGGQNDR